MLKNHDLPEAKTKEDEERIINEVKMRMSGKVRNMMKIIMR
jgi:hypothetical protein